MKEYTSKEYFQQLTILHLGMLAGMVIMSLILLFVVKPEPLGGSPTIWLYAIAGILILDFIVFSQLIPKRLEKIRTENDLKSKMGGYHTVFVLKLALIEGPAIVSIIAYFMNGDKTFLMIGLVLIAFFAINRPVKDKIIQTLELNREEISEVNNPDAIIAKMKSKNK